MHRIETSLPGVCLIEPTAFSDERGFFFESYHERKFTEMGIPNRFVQDNHSRSIQGTLRGLHYQLQHPQAKLCRVIQGEVLDVAVDIRSGSPTFGQWMSVVLSAANKRQIFIPAGLAHGFLVVSETAEFLYKCDDFYHHGDERGVAWDDPQLNIWWDLERWGIEQPLLSDKDRANPQLAAIHPTDLPRYSEPGA